ncbi:type VI secretion system tip protein VgrG [Herbaspirillum sp. BH-1]|uniref:Type VI secretion system secreted protein VgrG n=1 Tax=Herbaspirillum frisingense TaxID=92645 RepID=A0ABU1PBC3_9BURK|nr:MULTISPECIES: type VI secretion system Vgr family protein [Herbaspirillum]MDR6583216.1 type VI secretion system secreted protein VgrG [Herbaspirillum frisingense]PLY60130.1 type VI secretion system tip protein VgrG [Herbaspirillum sp. BH-1]
MSQAVPSFQQLLQQHQRQNQRLMRLHFPQDDAPASPLLVQRLDAEEAMSRDFSYKVELLSDDPKLALKEMLGKLLVIELVCQDGSLRYFSGHVISFCRTRADGAFVFYEAVLGPWFTFLSLRRDHFLFHEKNLRQQTNEILADYRPHARWEWHVRADDPVMTDACQYDETDHNYLSRRWEAAGWYYWYEHDATGHTLIVASDSRLQPAIDGDQEVRFHGAGGSQEEDAIDQWSPRRQMASANVALRSFNFKGPLPVQVGIATVNRQGRLPLLEDYEYTGHLGFRNLDHGEAQSRVRIEEIESLARQVEGQGNCCRLLPGRWFQLTDHFELPRMHWDRTPGHDEFLILGIRHRAVNNYLPREGDSDEPSYRNWFSCSRRPYPWRPGRGFNSTTPRVAGPQTATVVGLPGQAALYTDEYGRVRVQFHWDRAGKLNAGSSAWVRVASPWAGARLGAMALPRVGAEVVVQWLDGNPDRPLIIGSVYNAFNMPPWNLPSQRTLTGMRSRELTGKTGNHPLGRSNHMILDDTLDRMQAQLHSDHQSSQLSLGHLHRIEDEKGRQDARGEGWELRTDAWGVLRAGRGMLVTTESRPRARRHAKDLGETLARLVTARQEQHALARLAQRAGAQESDAQQAEVAAALKAQTVAIRGTGPGTAAGTTQAGEQGFPELSEPSLVLASAAGIAASSARDTHLASGGDTALTAGRHLSLAASGGFFASVRDTFRLFVQKAGLRMVAASGDIDLRALKDNIHLLAKLKITQTADEIVLSARQRIVLNGGGSYARFDGSGIELGTKAGFDVKADLKRFMGSNAMPLPQVDVREMTAFDERFRLVDEAGQPMANCAYRVVSSCGMTWEGRSDAQGLTPYFNTDQPSKLRLEILQEANDG